MHFVHKLSQAVAASEDLRCPSVYTLCLMRPCRPPSMHMGSMWSKNNLLLANLMPCQLLNALAGNVFFCRVFPSLHLQTWSVMTATCRRHVGQGVETTQHLKTVTTCLQMSAITWLLFEPKHLSTTKSVCVWAQTTITKLPTCRESPDMSSMSCCLDTLADMQCRRVTKTCRRHVADTTRHVCKWRLGKTRQNKTFPA